MVSELIEHVVAEDKRILRLELTQQSGTHRLVHYYTIKNYIF